MFWRSTIKIPKKKKGKKRKWKIKGIEKEKKKSTIIVEEKQKCKKTEHKIVKICLKIAKKASKKKSKNH